jgi:hypothetical protein
MKQRKEAPAPTLTYIENPATDQCDCLPLSALHKAPWHMQEAAEDFGQMTPATQEMNSHLRALLCDLFPRSTPLSVLLLHISQLEHIHLATKSAILHKRHRYHAPASFLDQVLVNMRRTIRISDHILVHAGTGIAIILPDVDQEGAHCILERVYHSINLLQPETVIPPLRRQTDIWMGIGSYPKPGTSLEGLLYHTGFVVQRLTLRPAVTSKLWGIRSTKLSKETPHEDHDGYSFLTTAHSSGIPFMQLPTRLSPRLKQLIPYSLALELHCAPVGRNHHRLTVAMAHPTDAQAIERLREATCMTIFAVSCEVTALDALLANGW